MKLSIDIGYIVKRIIVIILAFVIISSLKSCQVHAATCDPVTTNITYNDGSSWNDMNQPIVYAGVEKISYKFQNNNIGNNNITFSSNIKVNTSINFTADDIKIYADTNGTQNITSQCSISVGGNVPNSVIPQIRSIQLYEKTISVACGYTPTNGNATNIVVELDDATIENATMYGCLKINPNDTDQLLNGMAQNTNTIVEEMNYNAGINENQLNSIENAIEELFPNFGSCRKMGHVILTPNKALNSSGQEVDNSNYGISGMIRVYPTDTLDRMKPSADNVYACFYNNMNQLIECQTERQIINYQIPAVAYYVRFSWSQIDDSPETYHCSKDNQMLQNSLDNFLDFVDDSFVSDSNLNIGTSFFSQEIDTANNGLVAVITTPISILSRANETCSSKSFVIFGNTISLPCGTSLFWEKDFSNYNSIFRSGLTGNGLNNARDSFRLFWNVFFGGAIILHLLIKLYMVISDALDPDSCTVRSINSAIDTSDVSSYVPKHSYDYNR